MEKVTNLDELSDYLNEFIEECNKEVILIIDEVDKSSNNQLFFKLFWECLEITILDREKGKVVTFKSVILARSL